MELSKRLQAVANMMDEGIIVADVGTDHGYIPITYLNPERIQKHLQWTLTKDLCFVQRNILQHMD